MIHLYSPSQVDKSKSGEKVKGNDRLCCGGGAAPGDLFCRCWLYADDRGYDFFHSCNGHFDSSTGYPPRVDTFEELFGRCSDLSTLLAPFEKLFPPNKKCRFGTRKMAWD
jgi:hypothetical protein